MPAALGQVAAFERLANPDFAIGLRCGLIFGRFT